MKFTAIFYEVFRLENGPTACYHIDKKRRLKIQHGLKGCPLYSHTAVWKNQHSNRLWEHKKTAATVKKKQADQTAEREVTVVEPASSMK